MKVDSTTLLRPVPPRAGPSVRDIETHALFEEARQRRRRRRWLFASIVLAVAVAVGAVAVVGGRAIFGHNAATANTQPPGRAAYSGGVRFFVEQSAAMAPTLLPGDRISAVTRSSSLHTGDVVVFHPTNTSQGYPPGPEIKRIIGLPGERIASSGDTVLINGKPLAEPYLPLGQPFGAPIVTAVVPAGHYFVMGDNRADTEDSRYFGAIPSSSIIGVATAIVGPPSRAGPISGSSR